MVNTAYGFGDLDVKVRLEGGVAQGAPSSPLLYIFTTAAAHSGILEQRSASISSATSAAVGPWDASADKTKQN